MAASSARAEIVRAAGRLVHRGLRAGLQRAPTARLLRSPRALARRCAAELAGLGVDLAQRLSARGPSAPIRRRPSPGAAGAAAIEVRPAPPASATVATWVGQLQSDRGCGAPGGEHDACAAARRLGTLHEPSPDALEALEQTVVAPRRPGCVRATAIEALGRIDSPEAHRALRRMGVITRNRLAWDGRAEDAAALERIESFLR